MPTRFYLPASGTAPLTPTLGGGWETTTGYVTVPAPRTKSGTAYANGPSRQKGVITVGSDRLDRVHVTTEQLAAQTITGTFSMVLRTLESATGADAWLQVMIRVITSTGAIRGTLYAGSTATAVSAVVGAENEEFNAGAVQTRIKNALALTSVAAQAGDRLAFEIGYRALSMTTTVSATLRYGDPTGSTDFALTSGIAADSAPWIELSQNLVFAGGPDPGAFFHVLAGP